jgi:Gpi18-like mannosyltransferase
VVRRFRDGPAGAIAFAVAVLAPPFMIDSAHWGQTDSWVITPLVWMLWAMLGRRWLLAGVLWGVALGIKPQALLVGPVWLVALVIEPQRWRVLAGGALGPLVLLAAGLPFTLYSGWAWFERAFVANLTRYPSTTMKAFNVWYVDLLLSENEDAMLTIAGVAKDTWGKLLLTGLLVALTWWTIARGRGKRATLLYYAAAWLLITVIAPTRVHERYIVVPLAFLICAAALRRHLWWAVAPLLLAATFQITAFNWMQVGAQGWGHVVQKVHEQYARMQETLTPEELAKYPPPEEQLALDRPRYVAQRWATGDPYREWALVTLELVSAAACLALLFRQISRDENAASAEIGWHAFTQQRRG